jgi:hypothetical protein
MTQLHNIPVRSLREGEPSLGKDASVASLNVNPATSGVSRALGQMDADGDKELKQQQAAGIGPGVRDRAR